MSTTVAEADAADNSFSVPVESLFFFIAGLCFEEFFWYSFWIFWYSFNRLFSLPVKYMIALATLNLKKTNTARANPVNANRNPKILMNSSIAYCTPNLFTIDLSDWYCDN